MSLGEEIVQIPCRGTRSVEFTVIVSIIAVSGLIDDKEFSQFLDLLRLLPQYCSLINDADTYYQKRKLAIEYWVKANGTSANVAMLCSILTKMHLIALIELLQKPQETITFDEHICLDCLIVLVPKKIPSKNDPPLPFKSKITYENGGEDITEHTDLLLNNNLPIQCTNSIDSAIQKKHANRRTWNIFRAHCGRKCILLLVFAALCIICVIIFYFMGLTVGRKMRTNECSRHIHPLEITSQFELDRTVKPMSISEDDIINLGLYCKKLKKQPRRGIHLSLRKLKTSLKSLSDETLVCLKNVTKLNITGPMLPNILNELLYYTTNLKELTFHGMEEFCDYSKNYLESEVEYHQGVKVNSSIIKLGFRDFVNCSRGVHILSNVLNSNNLISIDISNCDFRESEIVSVMTIVSKSPNLMYFSCCGQTQCVNFKFYLKEKMSVLVEDNECMILHEIS